MSECTRCGSETAPTNTLPLADWRELTGENPVLCGECRAALVRWVNSAYEQGQDGDRDV